MSELIQADLSNSEHQQAILQILNAYAQEPIIGGEPLSRYVREHLIAGLQKHPTTVVLLVYSDDQPVGLAICFVGFSTFAAKPLLNIHDLAVLSEFRGQGVGRKLLAGAERKALELGCCKLTLEVYENNHPARRVYESFGFSSTEDAEDGGRAYFLYKRLDDEG